MNYLNGRISQYEGKLKQTQQYLKAQELEYEQLLERVWDFRSRYRQMAMLLTEFIEHYVAEDPEIIQKQQDIYLNIDEIKAADRMDEVAPESVIALCLVMLKQLQPFIEQLDQTKHQDKYQKRFNEVPSLNENDQNNMSVLGSL